VVSLGSFSKILAPGLRLGWVQAAPEHLQRLAQVGLVASGGGLNPFTAALVRSALELGLQETYLQKLQSEYRSRLNTLEAALERHLPDLPFLRPGGGYFVWLEVHTDTQVLLPKAMAAGLRFQPGIKFSSIGGLSKTLRLCFAFYPPEQLLEGVLRLAHVLEQV
jgi:2-aminoadipate transaminase